MIWTNGANDNAAWGTAKMLGEYRQHDERVESIKHRYRNSLWRFLVVLALLLTFSVATNVYANENAPSPTIIGLCGD